MNRPELILEKHPNGKCFIEIESLIAWFECCGGELERFGEYAVYALKGMKIMALTRPSRILTEEEYHAGEKGTDVQ